MAEYLGEEKLESFEGTPFDGFGPLNWALDYLQTYGGIDGDHHKMWTIDQAMRILLGTPIANFRIARWDNGEENYRFETGEPSRKYLDWVEDLKANDYSWDEGIAP